MSWLEASVNPQDTRRKTADPHYLGQINLSKLFFICILGLPSPKVGFERSALTVRKTRLFYSSGVRGSPKGVLAGIVVGVTGTKHNHNKLVITTS